MTISKYAFPYEVCVNVLESSKYGDEFVGISYSSNILNILKDCQRMCGDFIFTAACHGNTQQIKPSENWLWLDQ